MPRPRKAEEEAQTALPEGWEEMLSAPGDGTLIEVLLRDGDVVAVRWAISRRIVKTSKGSAWETYTGWRSILTGRMLAIDEIAIRGWRRVP